MTGGGAAFGVIVLGDPGRTHGQFDGVATADAAAAARFDSATDTWVVTTPDGRTLTGRVLVDTAPGDGGIVAAHGMPNHFRIPGPHTRRQARYLARLIDAMRRSGSTRIEARSRVRVHRLAPTLGPSRFYLGGPADPSGPGDGTYDGPAVLTHDGHDYPARVRLAGHLDPIDGQYHWQGMLYADLPVTQVTGSRVGVRIGEHTADARISERTPWGTLSVVGLAGYPPFPLEDVEVSLPPRV